MRRRVGSLIEQPGLYPDLSGRENLRLYAVLLGLDSPERQVEEILNTVGLVPGEKKPVRHYSMGMKEPWLLNERSHPAAGHRVPDGLAEDQRFPLGGPGQPAEEL